VEDANIKLRSQNLKIERLDGDDKLIGHNSHQYQTKDRNSRNNSYNR